MRWERCVHLAAVGNPAIGVEAHRALMTDKPNPKALMLNIELWAISV